MAFFSDLYNRLLSRCRGEEFAAVGDRLRQIEQDPHRHEYNYELLDGMHNKQTNIRHARRAEHNSREFWNNPLAEHPQELIEDRALPLHQSARTDQAAAKTYMIKDLSNDQLYNYTASLPIVHDEDSEH